MNVLIEQNIISTSIISIMVEKFILISHKIQQKPHLLSLSFYIEKLSDLLMRGLLLSPEQVFKLHCEGLKSNTLRADVCVKF